MSSLTHWVPVHERTVVVSWLALAIAGMVAAGPASNALEPEFSVPGKLRTPHSSSWRGYGSPGFDGLRSQLVCVSAVRAEPWGRHL
jgi:hypothetical protein